MITLFTIPALIVFSYFCKKKKTNQKLKYDYFGFKFIKECNGSPMYLKQILCRSEIRTLANDLLILAK